MQTLRVKIQANGTKDFVDLLKDVTRSIDRGYESGRTTTVSGEAYSFKLTGQPDVETEPEADRTLARQAFIIPATVRRDDGAYEAAFDAVEWFSTATPQEILAIVKCGWGGDLAADEVAEGLRMDNADVNEVLSHCSNDEGLGYEVHVDADAARKWLSANRNIALPED